MKRSAQKSGLDCPEYEIRLVKGNAILATAVAFGLMSWGGVAIAQDNTPTLEEMWQIIQQQQAEIDQLKSQNDQLRQ